MKIQSVCVYCGSNPGKSELYIQNARKLGEYLAKHNIRLVYGGSNCGTMGAVAESCLEHGGKVLGIITEQLHKIVGNPALTEYRVVPDMATRKSMFLKESDALIALPGGLGTADELVEAMSLQTLGLNRRPVAVMNINGFFDPLILWMERMCEEGFLRREQKEMMIAETDPEALFRKLETFEYHTVVKWNL